MNSLFIEKEIKYDGSQLTSHFAYKNFNLKGDSIIAFVGPVSVPITKMVDIEDVISNKPISSDKMLNFIIEIFDNNLNTIIWIQRVFISIIEEELNRILNSNSVIRNGNDLFYNNKKLSVSIATISPVSALIHTGINIKNTGAPIPISCLEDMNIDYKSFGLKIMELFVKEYQSVDYAKSKVNWVF